MTQAPGWTQPLDDDGWVGDEQRFPTARQIVCWADCPECGAAKGEYCTAGRVVKKTGEWLDLDDWLELHGANAPAPSCHLRCQRGRSELKRRRNERERKAKQIRKAVEKVRSAKQQRRLAKEAESNPLF